MGQIKFRAWNQEYKRMVYDLRLSQLSFYGDDLNYALSQTELMQFTGLQDKNGKDIYENDWVIIETISDIPRKVLFIDGGFRYITSKHFFTYPMSDYRSDEIEVIGNIHENPELLTNNPQ